MVGTLTIWYWLVQYLVIISLKKREVHACFICLPPAMLDRAGLKMIGNAMKKTSVLQMGSVKRVKANVSGAK